MESKQEVDIWVGMMNHRKEELMREGKSAEEAEDQACAEIRRQIRNG